MEFQTFDPAKLEKNTKIQRKSKKISVNCSKIIWTIRTSERFSREVENEYYTTKVQQMLKQVVRNIHGSTGIPGSSSWNSRNSIDKFVNSNVIPSLVHSYPFSSSLKESGILNHIILFLPFSDEEIGLYEFPFFFLCFLFPVRWFLRNSFFFPEGF